MVSFNLADSIDILELNTTFGVYRFLALNAVEFRVFASLQIGKSKINFNRF
jgi:hypothetical protein